MKASGVNYLVDAGPLVGLLSDSDQWHDWNTETGVGLGFPNISGSGQATPEYASLLHGPALKVCVRCLDYDWST